jgi:ArsR family transcriptional regulator
MNQSTSRDKKIYEMHAEICKIFTSPKRLEIINHLRDGEKTVNELAEQTGVLQANISQHLTVLRQNNVVTTRKEGTNVYYKIANPKILKACDLMREVLLEKLAENEKLAKRIL